MLRQQIEVLEEMNDKNKTRISQLDQTAAAQSRVSRLTEEEIKLQQQYA